MRNMLIASVAVLAPAACGKSESPAGASSTASASASGGDAMASVSPPARRPGLWEQTMVRDGKAAPMGPIRLCLDPSTDAKVSVFGRLAARSLCQRQAMSRGLDGTYRFTSSCQMGKAGTVATTGTASGDFSSHYIVRTESDVSGSSFPPLNGHHVSEMDSRWVGPCPVGMAPGEIVANGFRMNLNTMGAGAAVIGQ
jgi:hypothetical protein